MKYYVCMVMALCLLTDEGYGQLLGGQIKTRRSASISSLNCAAPTTTGTLTAGSAATGVAFTISYSGGNGAPYGAQAVASSGILGLTATLAPGNFANGAGTLTYTITGTPVIAGTANFLLGIGGQSCTLSVVVNGSGVPGTSVHSCGANNVHNPAVSYGSVSDQQGNVYKTVVIGGQEWMAEHLNTSMYRNGEPILTGLSATAWSTTNLGAWCHYLDDPSYACPYGKSYNWFACVDSRQLCPSGWHVPSDNEYSTLVNFLDPNANGGTSANTAGAALKSSGSTVEGNGLWVYSASTLGNNSSGFSGIPTGFRNAFSGIFPQNMGFNMYLWTATQDISDPTMAYDRNMSNTSNSALRNPKFKGNGFSVRCIKDNSSYGAINSLDCGSAVNNGTLTMNIAASNVSSMVSYTGGNGGFYNTSITASTGVTGLFATLAAGSFANGSGTLTYTITGTATSSGTALFALNIGGKTCTLSRVVSAQVLVGPHSCGANNVHNPALTYGTVTDQSGYTYKTIMINNREWMAENLKTYKYRNGDLIPVVSDDPGWNLALQMGYSCFVYNDSINKNCPYGKLYNHYAVADSRGLCPTGWHVPDNSEWINLKDGLDPGAGEKLKSTGTIQSLNGYWYEPNTNATNSSGFSGIPGGYRFMNGAFTGWGYKGYWWSSQIGITNSAGVFYLENNTENMSGNTFDRRNGCAVRCVRD